MGKTGEKLLDQVSGCLLGGAAGDALGAPVEFMSLSEIKGKFGEGGIQHYSPAYGKLGAITDDTQMTLFTLEGLLRTKVRLANKGIASYQTAVHHAYLRWLDTQGEPRNNDNLHIYTGWLLSHRELYARRAPGNSCLSALSSGKLWSVHDPANDSKGCGAVMRMAPVGLVGTNAPFEVGCELGALTHGHPTGYLSAGFFAHLISEIVHGSNLSDAVASGIAELKKWDHHNECLQSVKKALDLAAKNIPVDDAISPLGEGWVAEEALVISLYCALVAKNFAHGIILSVNHDGDSDSTGAITGNILGALWGKQAIPYEYLRDLELRDVIEEMARNTCELDLDDARDKYPGY